MTIRKSITIRELPSGWLAKERGTTYKTAHAALQATRREDRAIARDTPSSVVIRMINWEPTTNAGRYVVLALNPQGEIFGLTTPRNLERQS